jgi:hypothetical protein
VEGDVEHAVELCSTWDKLHPDVEALLRRGPQGALIFRGERPGVAPRLDLV